MVLGGSWVSSAAATPNGDKAHDLAKPVILGGKHNVGSTCVAKLIGDPGVTVIRCLSEPFA